MPTRFAVVSVWAEDTEKTGRFYRDALGLEMMPGHEDPPHFRLGDIYFVVLKGKPTAAVDTVPDRFPLFALAVDDLDETVRRMEQHGVRMPWGIESEDGQRWVMFHDPGGNLIEVMQFP